MRSLLFASIVISTPISAWAQQSYCDGELCPGRIWNPPAYQWDQSILYVPTKDQYLLSTTEWDFVNGGLVGRVIKPDGTFSGSAVTYAAGGNAGVTHGRMAYNSNADDVLLVLRDADPSRIRGLYLDTDGQPIGSLFHIAGSSDVPHIAYSPDSNRYLVTYSYPSSGVWYVYYVVIDGDRTNPNPVLSSGTVDSNALSDIVVYNSVTQKFLVVYTKDLAPPRRADIYGARLSANGVPEAVFAIETSVDNQQQAQIAYSDSTNTFMLVYEDFRTQQADATGAILNGDGSMISRFGISETNGWDVPGPITYNSATKTFIATWRIAYSDYHLEHYAREYKPADGTPNAPKVLITTKDIGLVSADSRPDAADPQALITFNQSYGLDGVHVGIYHLPSAPPEIQPPMPEGFFQVSYAEKIPVAGGRAPLTYEFLNGTEANLPAGLSLASDFATSGMVEGTTTVTGTTGTLTVRVTDNDGRSDEEDLTLTISLQPPTPTGPSGSSNDTTPTFAWSESPGATSYDIEVENLTDGGLAIDTNVSAPPFTPGTALPEPKQYRWRVRTFAPTSAWSAWLSFDIELTPPSQADLMVMPSTAFTPLAVTYEAASSQINAKRSPDKAMDGDPSTFWSSEAPSVQGDEFITLDLGSIKSVSRVRLRSRQATAVTFPVDFSIMTSLDNASFQTALSVSSFSATADTEHFFPISATQARYVKIAVTKVTAYFGRFYTQIAEVGVDEGSQSAQSLVINWSAVGDDGMSGTATSYDLRWSFNAINSGNFDSATSVPGAPGTPKASGELEEVLFSGLLDETTYFIGLKVFDDAGNSSLDADFGTTMGVAPSPIQDLAASNPQLTSVDLTFSPVGDDGMVGITDHYEIAFATFEINAANFDSASKVSVGDTPSPNVPGGAQHTVTVGSLSHTTDYYFAIRVFDEKGNFSMSNVVMQSTRDNTPPASVALTGISGAVVPSLLTGVTAVLSSGEINATRSMDKTVDGDTASFWTTPGRVLHQQEFIQWNLGSVKELTRVRLRSRSASGLLFPVDYRVDVSLDGNAWSTIATATGTSVGAGEWLTYDFPTPENALFVRVLVLQAAQYSVNGMFYTQIAEAEFHEFSTVGNSVTALWSAAGDDGNQGTASQHHLCYSTSVDEAFVNFCANETGNLLQPPVSGPAGTSESHSIGSLPDETRYYVNVKTEDDAGLFSGNATPNGFFVDTPGTAPAAVSNLRFTDIQGTSLTATWEASGDDGTGGGPANNYQFCYSTSQIDTENFCTGPAATLLSLPVNMSFPNEESHQWNVASETTYYVAIIVRDELDNASPLSSVITATTPDVTAPSPVTDFMAAVGQVTFAEVSVTAVAASGEANAKRAKEKAVDGDLTSFWTTPGRNTLQEEYLIVDVGSERNLGRVRMRSRSATGLLFPVDFELQTAVVNEDSSYQTQVTVTGSSVSAGTWSSFTFPAPVNARYMRLKVTRPGLYAVNNHYYTQLSELAVDEASVSGEVALTWKASGDNGTVGTATSYQLCYSQTQTDVTVDFCQATGTMETLAVSGGYLTEESRALSALSGESTYYFGIEVRDEVSNSSTREFTNVATPAAPPSPVTEFMVTGQTVSSVSLSWKASGNDGLLGIADHYDLCISTSTIDELNFCAGTEVAKAVTGGAGTLESYTQSALTEDTDYYFGIRVDDGNGGLSTLSVLPVTKTLDGTAPELAPNFSVGQGVVPQQASVTVIDVSGEINAKRLKEEVVDGDTLSFWSSPARAVAQEEFLILDLSSSRTVKGVRLRSRHVSGLLFPEDFAIETSLVNTNASYQAQVAVTGFTAAPATWYDFTFSSPVTARFIRLKITKSRQYFGNFYAQLSELIVDEEIVESDKISVNWDAPHENGASGGAATQYHIMIDTNPILEETPSSSVAGLPTPAAPGVGQSFLVQGLDPATTYYIVLWSEDEAGNFSPGASGSSTTGP